MKQAIIGLAIATLVLGTGCIAIHSTGFSNVDPNASMVFSTHASGIGILAVTVPDIDELENRAITALKQQGATKNVRVRLEMRNFMVVQMYKVIALGEK